MPAATWRPSSAIEKRGNLQPGALKEDSLDIARARDGTIYFRHTNVKFFDQADQIRMSVQQAQTEKPTYV